MNIKTVSDNAKKTISRGWNKVKKGAKSAVVFCSNNKELMIIAIPAAVTIGTSLCKTTNKAIALRKDKIHKELYCYDCSAGHYWRLKRPLTSEEWVYVDKRHQDGERISEILSELNVLK